MRATRAALAVFFVAVSGVATAGMRNGSDEATLSGKEIYDDACASCHGVDGRGAPAGTAIAVPLPDFTDCNFVTRESDGNWLYLLEYGGTGLGPMPVT